MAIAFYTVDIGHGLCQVVRFGDRAILIDGGGKLGKRVTEEFLKRFIRVIVAYVATHNDADHVAAAPELLDHFSTAATLESIWILIDRPARNAEQVDEDVIPLIGYSKRRAEEGSIGRRCALYVHDDIAGRAKLIHREAKESAELQLLYPRLLDSTEAAVRGEPSALATNQVSAILRLVVGADKKRAAALITGDANCESLRIAREVYKFDLSARTLSVPHHGGEVPRPGGAPDWDTVVGWVAPEIAVVSAGFGRVPQTTVTRRRTFDPLRRPGVTTACTQLTSNCHPHFKDFYPGILPASRSPLPQMSGRPEFPDAVGCAGTITIRISTDGDVSMLGTVQHQQGVDQKVVPGDGCPHCR